MNPRVAEIPPSLIRAINARKRPGDIDLGLGEPTLRPALEPFDAATRWIAEHGCPYTPNAGFPELRAAIARRYGGHRFPEPESVCVTVGSEEAIYLAIKTVVDPDRDEVLVVEPCYLAYPKICGMEGIRHRTVALSPEEGFRPDAGRVLSALREDTRLLVLNSPANPTGRIWPREELRALARGLTDRPRPVYVLWDDVYRELYYGEEPPASLAEYHPHTLIAGSLSKSNALTGLRLGWLIGPAEAVQGAIKVHQFVNTAASTFSQRVALALLERPDGTAEHREWYARMREVLLEAAAGFDLPVLPPEGAFYAMVRLPERLRGDSVHAAGSLLDRCRVVTVPGRAFGESGEGWLRLSWVAPEETLVEGVRRLGEALREGLGK